MGCTPTELFHASIKVLSSVYTIFAAWKL